MGKLKWVLPIATLIGVLRMRTSGINAAAIAQLPDPFKPNRDGQVVAVLGGKKRCNLTFWEFFHYSIDKAMGLDLGFCWREFVGALSLLEIHASVEH